MADSINYQLAKFVASYGKVSQIPESTCPEVSFVGRSNVGKSSIMNKLFGRKNLVKDSSTPGKTSNINFFEATGRDQDGELIRTEWQADQKQEYLNYKQSGNGSRTQYVEAAINYSRTFGEKHEVGGLLLGFIEIMTVAFMPSLSGYRDAFAFVVLVLVLLVKPTGLFGQRSEEKI